MSNIEKDIKNIKQYINLVLDEGYCDCNELNMISTGRYCDGSKNVAYSMQNILSERKQDKARIQQLEEILLEVKDKNITLFIACRNSIPKQKIIDKIKEIKEDKESKYFDTFLMARDINYAIKILEELLEDK